MKISISNTKTNLGKILTDDFDFFDKIRDNFSITEKNFAYIKRCRALSAKINPSKENIKKSCIKMNGEFDLGLLHNILKFCKKELYTRTVNYTLDDNIKKYLENNDIKLNSKVYVNEEGAKPRDYQIESMQLALNKQNGVFVLGTGAGKTLCIALLSHNLIYNNLAKKVLIICPFPDLANQTCDEINKNLNKYKRYKFAKWFGKHKFDSSANIVVAGSDIIRSQFEQYKDELKKFDCIIVDEAHQLKSTNKISKIISQLPAKFRYGFTGTLPDNDLDKWSLIGKIGPVRYVLSSAELREGKFLTPVSSTIFRIPLENVPTYNEDSEGNKQPFTYMDEVEWVSSNEQFNNVISRISKVLKNNTLILTNRLTHNEILVETLSKIAPDKQVFSITGEVDIDSRGDIKKAMEENNNVIVIATVSCFSTGINVKNIHNIIFPGLIGKASTRIIQSIGRGLRLNPNKSKLNVYDLVPMIKYSLRHLDARKEIYDKEKIPYIEKFVNL